MIKIIHNTNSESLENDVNEFINSEVVSGVKSVQFQAATNGKGYVVYSCMIDYNPAAGHGYNSKQ